MLFDRLALAILSSVLSYGLLHTHPAISIVIGIVVFLLLSKLQYTKIGFWTISGLLSLFLGFVFSLMTYRIAEKDMIWTCVVFGLVTLIVLRLHIHAQNKIDKV